MKRWAAMALALLMLAAPALAEEDAAASLVERITMYHALYGADADAEVAAGLAEMEALDADLAARWAGILNLWTELEAGAEIHEKILPDGLPDTDELCLVVLGFHLKPDGSMRKELIERCKVAAACAQKYPNALIVCTGGGTATENASATEAGRMAKYLVKKGIAEERIIVEDRSKSTGQNAMFTCELLAEQYPQVRQLAIISSSYHIPTGVLLFSAKAALMGEKAGEPRFTVVSNAAHPVQSNSQRPLLLAGGLIEVSGNRGTAIEIYRGTYNPRKWPKPAGQ